MFGALPSQPSRGKKSPLIVGHGKRNKAVVARKKKEGSKGGSKHHPDIVGVPMGDGQMKPSRSKWTSSVHDGKREGIKKGQKHQGAHVYSRRKLTCLKCSTIKTKWAIQKEEGKGRTVEVKSPTVDEKKKKKKGWKCLRTRIKNRDKYKKTKNKHLLPLHAQTSTQRKSPHVLTAQSPGEKQKKKGGEEKMMKRCYFVCRVFLLVAWWGGCDGSDGMCGGGEAFTRVPGEGEGGVLSPHTFFPTFQKLLLLLLGGNTTG